MSKSVFDVDIFFSPFNFNPVNEKLRERVALLAVSYVCLCPLFVHVLTPSTDYLCFCFLSRQERNRNKQ